MAYHTDYIARDWHLTYSQRKGRGRRRRRATCRKAPSAGTCGTPASGPACRTAATASTASGSATGRAGVKMEGRVPGLVGHMCPDYGVLEASRSDRPDPRHRQRRSLSLRNTTPVRQGRHDAPVHRHEPGRGPHRRHQARRVYPPSMRRSQTTSPSAAWSSTISKGPHWKETAIFVIEDDAQNGPGPRGRAPHRRPGDFSPFTKRKHSRLVHNMQYRQHDPHDGTGPGPAAAEPVRRRGPPHVRQLHRRGRRDAVHARAPPRSTSTPRTPSWLTGPTAATKWTSATTTSSTTSS